MGADCAAICRGIHRASGPDVRRITSALLELVPHGGEDYEFDHLNSEGAQSHGCLTKQLVGDADDRGRERPNPDFSPVLEIDTLRGARVGRRP